LRFLSGSLGGAPRGHESKGAGGPGPGAARRGVPLIQHRDTLGKAVVLLALACCAVAVTALACVIPPRPKTAAAGPTRVPEPAMRSAFPRLFTGSTAPVVLGLDYQVSKKVRAGEKTTAATLARVRDAGLLRGYSLPPGRLAFTPSGGVVFLPEPPVAVAPVPPLAIARGNRDKPRVALTFDTSDVPDSNARPIMDELTRLRAPATFFVCGAWCRSCPALLKALVDRGFEVANHSYTHPQSSKIPPEILAREITATDQAFREITGGEMAAYFRPPFGDWDARVRQVAAQCGYRVVIWNRDTLDWSPATIPEQIRDRATADAANGDIVLMHCHGRYTPAMLEQIVNNLRAKGFELTTVTGVLQP